MSLSSCIVLGFIFGQGALLNVTVCLGGVDGDRECSRVVFVLVRLGPLIVFFFLLAHGDKQKRVDALGCFWAGRCADGRTPRASKRNPVAMCQQHL